MKCIDCEKYYLGCDTEVFNYGYEKNKAEECELFLKKGKRRAIHNTNIFIMWSI